MRRAVMAAIFSLAAIPAGAQTPPPPAAPVPSQAPATRQVDFTSTVNGHGYRLRIALPLGLPPRNGYPVIYVLDGDGFFGSFTEASRVRAGSRELPPAVIVGIGFPESDTLPKVLRRRLYDLTPSQGDAAFQARAKAAPGGLPETGGGDGFLKVIETEVKPRVAAVVKVDPSRSTLWGHSLGGLLVVRALFTQPASFATFIAQSPSLWWDGKLVLKDEAGFAAAVRQGAVQPRIFIGSGGAEQSVPPSTPEAERAATAREVAEAAMVDNAQGLARRLAALKGGPNYRVSARVFEGESHASVPFAALNTALDFALAPPPAVPR